MFGRITRGSFCVMISHPLKQIAHQGFVVEVKLPLTPPMDNVVVVTVEFVEADVCRTRTVSPFVTVPDTDVHEPLLILYSLEGAPLSEIEAEELIPLTVMAPEVRV